MPTAERQYLSLRGLKSLNTVEERQQQLILQQRNMLSFDTLHTSDFALNCLPRCASIV